MARESVQDPAALSTGWLVCPLCGERFRPRPAALAEILQAPSDPGPDGRRPPGAKFSALAEAWRRGRGETSAGEAAWGGPVPGSKLPAAAVKVLCGALAAAFLVGLLLIFRGAAASPPAETAQPVPKAPPGYAEAGLARDLSVLLKGLRTTSRAERFIEYAGRETRVYLQFVEELAPDRCRRIAALRLWSERTSEGFNAKALCVNPSQAPAELRVRRAGDDAVEVWVVGFDGRLSVPLGRSGERS